MFKRALALAAATAMLATPVMAAPGGNGDGNGPKAGPPVVKVGAASRSILPTIDGSHSYLAEVDPDPADPFSPGLPVAAWDQGRVAVGNGEPESYWVHDDMRVTAVAFEEQRVDHALAQVLSEAGARQLHAAETEKYAHVTYFLNGGEEREWAGETRILVPSPRDVPSYDLKPEMSAYELAERFCADVGDGYRFAVVNFANPDMVGHTGSIPAVVAAVEAVDACLGRVAAAVERAGGVCLVTADHGNAEVMLEPDGVSPHTAHTTNLVPLVLTQEGLALREEGELSDLAPTILTLLGLPVPAVMTGRPLATAL